MIGNKTFIEKIEHHVHDSEHSEQGKIQPNQELKERESKNSDKEMQLVQPQIQAQRNKAPKRNDFKRSKGLSLSSKKDSLLDCY